MITIPTLDEEIATLLKEIDDAKKECEETFVDDPTWDCPSCVFNARVKNIIEGLLSQRAM